ncbi:MAG: LuxR C-terminal-related transcriptional regulator [Tepidisphaeraceae bacterium]
MDCTRLLYEPATLELFPLLLVGQLRRLVAGEYAVYEEMNLARHRATGYADPPEIRPVGNPRLMAVFESNMHLHPLIAHFAETKSQQALAISDFVSRADWHRSVLHNDFYRQQGNIEDQLGAFIASRGGLTVATAVGRKNRTFTDRDRKILTLLQPHIEQAYRNAELLTDLSVANKALGQELDAIGEAVVRLTLAGEFVHANAAARRLLDTCFTSWTRRPDRGALPEPLLAWLADVHSPGELTSAEKQSFRIMAADRGQFFARLLRGPTESTLLLRHTPPSAAVSLRAAALDRLSPRLRQVFDLIIIGLSEKQIAERLALSQHTVHRHVSILYRRLDVASRSELMARYMR